jgi:ribosomal protein S18 acetylase RimI-like enzyme
MDIRVLKSSDIPHVQLANITNLPENYFCKYYLYHAMSWPQLSYVAVDVSWCSHFSLRSVSVSTTFFLSCGQHINLKEMEMDYRGVIKLMEGKRLL